MPQFRTAHRMDTKLVPRRSIKPGTEDKNILKLFELSPQASFLELNFFSRSTNVSNLTKSKSMGLRKFSTNFRKFYEETFSTSTKNFNTCKIF